MYQISVSDWRKIPQDNLKLIYSQAQRKLDYTLYNSDKITNRFYSVLIVLAGLLTAGIGYIVKNFKDNPIENNKYWYIIIFLTLVLILLLICIKNIYPRFFMGKGRSPSELNNIDLLQPSENFSDSELYIAMLIGEVNNLEHKIFYNLKQNQSRLKVLKRLIYSIVILLVCFFILFQVHLLM